MKYFGVIISVLLALSSCSHKGDAMRERLDYVSECNRADTVFTEAWLPTVDSLAQYFDRHGNANERMMAHYLQGRVHHDMGEAPIALECYQKAMEVADTTSNDSSTLHTLAAIYGQMADLFHLQYLPDDEMKAIKMAEHFDWKNKDTIAAITAYRLRAGVYYLRNDTDSMLLVTRKSVEMYKKHGKDDIAAQVLIFPISVSLDRGDYRNAWQDMQTLENESGFFDQEGNVLRGKEIYYYYKGMYLLSQNQADSAIVLFGKAVSAGFLEAGYKGLMSAYEKKNNPDSVAKYARLFANANDNSYMGVEQEIVHKTSALYNYNRQRRIAEINARKASLNKMVAISIALLGITSLIVVYKRVKSQSRRKLAKLSQDYESAFNNLSIAKDRLRLLNYDYEANNQRLEAEIIELRQIVDKAHNAKREFDKDMNGIQCRLNDLLDENNELRKQHKCERREKEREIARLQELVKSLEERLQMEDVLATESRFKSTIIYKKFMVRGRSRHVLFPPAEKDWEDLAEAFRLHFVRFYSLITHQHSLPTNQYRLCLLIRLGATNEQLRILLDKDTQQVYRLKRLANQALFGSQDASTLEDNLRQYFY